MPIIHRESPWLRNGADIYYTNGKIGIGTTNPGARLDVGASGGGGTPGIKVSYVSDGAKALHINTESTDGSLYVENSWSGYSGTLMQVITSAKGDNSNYNLFAVNNTAGSKFLVRGDGNVGIGTVSPDRLLHPEIQDSVTNAVTYGQRITHGSSGTVADGFGTGYEIELEDDGGTNRIAAEMQTIWATAASATRKARTVFTVYDTAVREALRLEASGAAAMIGFLGAGAVIRQTGYAVPTDLTTCIDALTTLRTALINYGLITTV